MPVMDAESSDQGRGLRTHSENASSPNHVLREPSAYSAIQDLFPAITISIRMEPARIAELLEPFLTAPLNSGHSEQREESAVLTPDQLKYISMYIDMLLRWNARINLTAIRQPEEIVTRHFGESLFAARHLFPAKLTWGQPPQPALSEIKDACIRLIDVGSGAGFPGLPIKIWAPQLDLTLIESNHKKGHFPARSQSSAYIDERQCILRTRRELSKPSRRSSDPPRSRAFRDRRAQSPRGWLHPKVASPF